MADKIDIPKSVSICKLKIFLEHIIPVNENCFQIIKYLNLCIRHYKIIFITNLKLTSLFKISELTVPTYYFKLDCITPTIFAKIYKSEFGDVHFI